jgi:hypothetical protein
MTDDKEEDKMDWLDGNRANLQWLTRLYDIDFIKEFKKVHTRSKSFEWYNNADKNELLTIINEQHRLIGKLEFLFRDAGENATIEDHYMAKQSAEHWKTIQKFLKDNPAMQDQWETFLMAMRLTQD